MQLSSLEISAKEFILARRGHIQPIVYKKLKLLVERNPGVEQVYLIGSYANGDWCDKLTPAWFRKFRESIGKSGLSDVDFVTVPQVESTEDYDIQPGSRQGKILIYDHKNTII